MLAGLLGLFEAGEDELVALLPWRCKQMCGGVCDKCFLRGRDTNLRSAGAAGVGLALTVMGASAVKLLRRVSVQATGTRRWLPMFCPMVGRWCVRLVGQMGHELDPRYLVVV